MYLYSKEDSAAALSKLGVKKLYPWQEEVLRVAMHGEDIFFRQATAGGKSLIFQLMAAMEAGRALTVVISPLRALQRGQVSKLRDCGITAALLNADLSPGERQDVLRNLPSASLLYLAPEQLGNRELLEALHRCAVARVVVDEAHVLPQAELSFRKAYGRIGSFIDALPQRVQIIACTATATPRERRRIIRSLGMENPAVFLYPVRRGNLRLEIRRVEASPKQPGGLESNLFHAVERVLERWDGKGSVILYTPTAKRAVRLRKWLGGRGWKAAGYTGKMPRKKRQRTLDAFLTNKKRIIVATNAFGLGIDKPDVRLVIHAGLPLTLGGYVQEIGRAGRDGKKAKCVLLYSNSDFARNEHILRRSGGKKAVQRALRGLNALRKLLESKKCLWKTIERYYGEQPGKNCNHCPRCKLKK